jgi:hypothetical protein
MKKTVSFSLLITLISFLLLLSQYLLIEEILGLYLIPIVLIVIVGSIFYLLIRIFIAIPYKKIIVIFLMVGCILQIFILSLILWSATPRHFSRNQILDDIDYAIKISEDVHPNLYSSISKADFYFITDSIKKLMPKKVSDASAYKAIRKIFSLVHDAHTAPTIKFFFKRGSGFFMKTLPCKLEIKDERVFISKNYGYKNNIPIGSEIISINEKPVAKCIKEVSQLLSYEIRPYRNTLLQIPYFWGLWNDFKDYEISYMAPGSKTIKIIKTSGGLISNLTFISDFESGNKPYTYKIISDGIGYIDFKACKNLDSFKIFLNTTFQSIKTDSVKSLIIDIRKNSGGNSSLADELMQYISKTSYRMFDLGCVMISKELVKRGKLNWIDSSKREIGTLYSFIDSTKTKLRDNPLRFTGKSYLLVGGNTFSSASNFASAFQCYKVGKIIGTETGGITVCYGDIYRFDLPHTKFDMGVSYKKFYNACGVDDKRGVLPDCIVENSFEDERNGIDRVLEFTINLIKQNKK